MQGYRTYSYFVHTKLASPFDALCLPHLAPGLDCNKHRCSGSWRMAFREGAGLRNDVYWPDALPVPIDALK